MPTGLLSLLWVGRALAGDVALVPVGACWSDETTCVVDVAVGEAGAPRAGADVVIDQLPTASPADRRKSAPAVESIRPIGAPGDGLYRFEVRTDAALSVRVDGAAPVPLPRVPTSARPAPTVRIDAPRDLSVADTVDVPLRADPDVRTADLLVAASEGAVELRDGGGGQIVARVTLSPDRTARVLGIGVLDRRFPGAAPVWAAVPLRARQTADVQIGAHNRVDVQVGSRRYGPFVADAAGQARLTFDVLPGEATAQITAVDDLGNKRTVQSPLPTRLSSVLAVLAAPVVEDRGVTVRTHVWDASGRDDRSVTPSCVAPDGPLRLRPLAGADMEAIWSRADGAGGDFGVDCAAGLATARAQVLLGAGQPDHLALRVYPESLASDFPLAQVQVELIDRRGERLAPDGVAVRAEHGELTTTVQDGVVRGDYRGEAAVPLGGDHLAASWRAAPGGGAPWALDLAASVEGAAPVAVVRVRDRAGNPLAGAEVRVSAGGPERSAVSDAAGWARVSLEPRSEGLWVVSARAGGVRADAVVFPARPVALPDPALPDLSAATDLPIRAGKVRRIYLDVRPRPLPLDGTRVARVTVQLLDAAGNLVRGEDVQLEASLGTFGPLAPLPDGTIQADWAPPPGTVAHQARITASVGDTSVATDLELVPRAARGTVGVSAGWITNFRSISSPMFALAYTSRVPRLPAVVEARVGATGWGISRAVPDDQTGGTIQVSGQFLALDVGPVLVERSRGRVLEGGVSLVVMPYALTVDYGDERGVFGGYVAPPGVLLHVAPGLRFGNAEGLIEARYLFVSGSPGSVGLAGGAGGLSLSARYRLLF